MNSRTIKNYEHYIFDCDYTLFDTSQGMEKCYKEALKAIGVSYDSQMLDTYVKESLKSTFRRYNTDYPFSMFERVFLETSKVYMCKLSNIYPDTTDCLQQLFKNNSCISIVTGKPRERVIEILKKYNLESLISVIIGYGEYTKPKPDPESLNLCINQIDISRRLCVYVGDSTNDILAAHNSEIDGILIDRTGQTPHAIKSLMELIT